MPSGHREGSKMTTNVEIKHLSTKQVLYQQTQSLILNCLSNKEKKNNVKSLSAQYHTASRLLMQAGNYLASEGQHQ